MNFLPLFFSSLYLIPNYHLFFLFLFCLSFPIIHTLFSIFLSLSLSSYFLSFLLFFPPTPFSPSYIFFLISHCLFRPFFTLIASHFLLHNLSLLPRLLAATAVAAATRRSIVQPTNQPTIPTLPSHYHSLPQSHRTPPQFGSHSSVPLALSQPTLDVSCWIYVLSDLTRPEPFPASCRSRHVTTYAHR